MVCNSPGLPWLAEITPSAAFQLQSLAAFQPKSVCPSNSRIQPSASSSSLSVTASHLAGVSLSASAGVSATIKVVTSVSPIQPETAVINMATRMICLVSCFTVRFSRSGVCGLCTAIGCSAVAWFLRAERMARPLSRRAIFTSKRPVLAIFRAVGQILHRLPHHARFLAYTAMRAFAWGLPAIRARNSTSFSRKLRPQFDF